MYDRNLYQLLKFRGKAITHETLSPYHYIKSHYNSFRLKSYGQL